MTVRKDVKRIQILFVFSLLILLSGCNLFTNKKTTIKTTQNTSTTTISTTTQTTVQTTTITSISDPDPTTGEIMSMHFIDVGQGSSTLIMYKDRNILIDAGTELYGPTVVNYLKSVGVENLWIVIGTHPDADHIGGLDHVLREFEVDYVVDSGYTHSTGEYQQYMNEIMNRVENNGTEFILDSEIEEYWFYFEEDNPNIYLVLIDSGDLSYTNVNDHTVVGLLVYEEVSLFLSGDMESASENYLLERIYNNELEINIDSTIYTAAHHGSRTSNSYAILDVITPEYVIISAGLNNSYGHPHSEVMDRYAYYTEEVFITYEVCSEKSLCAITIETNGKDVFIDEVPTSNLPELKIGEMEFINFFEQSPVGQPVTITLQGEPNKMYDIDFYLPSGSLSGSSAFVNKMSDSNGLVLWTYSITSNTKTGFGSIIVKDVETGTFVRETFRFVPR